MIDIQFGNSETKQGVPLVNVKVVLVMTIPLRVFNNMIDSANKTIEIHNKKVEHIEKELNKL